MGDASTGARAGCASPGVLRSLTAEGSFSASSITSISDGSATSISGPFRRSIQPRTITVFVGNAVEHARQIRMGGENVFSDARREIGTVVRSEVEIGRTFRTADRRDGSDHALVFSAQRH